jgi:hypothetical protein
VYSILTGLQEGAKNRVKHLVKVLQITNYDHDKNEKNTPGKGMIGPSIRDRCGLIDYNLSWLRTRTALVKAC